MQTAEQTILTVDYSITPARYQIQDNDPTCPILLRPKRRDVMQLDIAALKWTTIQDASDGRWSSSKRFFLGDDGRKGKILLDSYCMEALLQRPDLLTPLLQEHRMICFYGASLLTHEGWNVLPCIKLSAGEREGIEDVHDNYLDYNNINLVVPYYEVN